MVESLITSPGFWRQSGKHENKMAALKAYFASLPRADEAPMLVWTTLEKAINGWCVEEYRIQQQWFQSQLPEFTFDGMTMGEVRDAIRAGDISITPSNFGGSDTAVTVTYKVSRQLLSRLKRR